MVEFCFFVVVLTAIISFCCRMREFNMLPIVQKEAISSFNQIKEGCSLSELNELFGKKAKKVSNTNKYRWYFGDSIIVKKGKDVVSFSDFNKDIDHYRDYKFENCISYIEVIDNNGILSNPVAVGLN